MNPYNLFRNILKEDGYKVSPKLAAELWRRSAPAQNEEENAEGLEEEKDEEDAKEEETEEANREEVQGRLRLQGKLRTKRGHLPGTPRGPPLRVPRELVLLRGAQRSAPRRTKSRNRKKVKLSSP